MPSSGLRSVEPKVIPYLDVLGIWVHLFKSQQKKHVIAKLVTSDPDLLQ